MTLRPRLRRVGALAAAMALTASPGVSQDNSGADKHLTLLGIPSATVAPGGSVYGGLSYATSRPGPGDDADGSMSLGFGLGDANESIGLQVSAEIISLKDEFGDSGYFEIKASRRIAEGRTPLYLGLGVSDLAPWGDTAENETSFDLMLTGFHLMQTSTDAFPVMFTVGAGTHVRDNGTEPGAYAGLGVGLSDSFAASVSWYGDYAVIGASFAPAGNRNLSLTASLVDVTDETGDQRGVFSINYVFPKAFGG